MLLQFTSNPPICSVSAMIDHLRLDLSQVKVLSLLGRGAKGIVFLVQNKLTHEFLALKVIFKASIIEKKRKNKKKTDKTDDDDNSHSSKDDGNEYRRILFEQKVLMQLQHPLLPKLHGLIDTNNIFGYAIDYCPGRDLNSLRKKQTEKMFSDDIIRFYAAELVLVLEHLHKLGIVYRDLKPENIMIQDNGHLMLVDFDLSTKLSPVSPQSSPSLNRNNFNNKSPVPATNKWRVRKWFNSGISPEKEDSVSNSSKLGHDSESDSVLTTKSNSFVGTEEYVAPEIILGNGHDFSVDWWSLGVVLYEMLYGTTPFRGANRKETFYWILTKKPELVGETTPLRDLIGKLLEKDPKQRIGLQEIKGHDFFKGVDWDLVIQIPRTPYIPLTNEIENEDMDGIKEINVEEYVQGLFSGGGEDHIIHRYQKDANNDDTESHSSHNTDSTDNFSNF